jgi:hypothetical protein
MRKIYIYDLPDGEVGILVDDTMMTNIGFDMTPTKILNDTQENRDLYGLTADNEPKVVNVLKSST